MKRRTKNPVLLNHALIEWFENTLRELIQEVLRDAHGEEWWWEGVPSDVRKKYGERVQETRLEEERKLPELYFIDFYFYVSLIFKEFFGNFVINLVYSIRLCKPASAKLHIILKPAMV